MLEPSPKSAPISDFLEKLSGRTTAIYTQKCIDKPFGCGRPITEFRDKLSEKEYTISGLYQSCQDSIFKE